MTTQTDYEMRDRTMRRAFPAKHYNLFGSLVHAICDLEDTVARREGARWQRRDDDAPTYEELNTQVQEARVRMVDEAIKLAASGVIPSRTSVAP